MPTNHYSTTINQHLRVFAATLIVATAMTTLSPGAHAQVLRVEATNVSIIPASRPAEMDVLRFSVPIPSHARAAGGERWCLASAYQQKELRWLASSNRCVTSTNSDSTNPSGTEQEQAITWYALLGGAGKLTADFQLTTDAGATPREVKVAIDITSATTANPMQRAAWATARNALLASYQRTFFQSAATPQNSSVDPTSGQSLLGQWRTISAMRYGLKPPEQSTGRRARNTTNVFSLLSGEAAIQETLQRQLLQNPTSAGGQGEAVPVSTLHGPDIPSHPFTELLNGGSGRSLEIANLIPTDRWMLHLSDPASALPWLHEMGHYAGELRGLSQQSYFDPQLIERYQQRLNLPASLLTSLAPLIEEAALFGPDLYFEHGSHITLVAKTSQFPGLSRLLGSLLNNDASTTDQIRAYGKGEPAYFAQHNRWLIFSTSRSEAHSALDLAHHNGNESLGQSAEFRYMAQQLPPAKRGMYLYLSDPFIRAMTGPKMKISQLRRHQARTRLQLVTAANLLSEADSANRERAETLSELVSNGSIDTSWLNDPHGDRVTQDAAGMPRSSLYGSLAWMTPISDLSIEQVSSEEAKNYQAYVDSYSRFWRTTFDPIAIRMEIGATAKIDTLILPLINNSIYDSLRAAVAESASAQGLAAITPKPITQFSVQLADTALEQLGEFRHRRRALLAQQLSSTLTGKVEFALFDTEPLIAFGSADLLGAFSGPLFNRRFGLSLYGGAAASLLTQPAAVLLELQPGADADQVAQALFQMSGMGWMNQTLERYGNNGWVYSVNFEDIVRYHLYIYASGGYLVISNRSKSITVSPQRRDRPAAHARLAINFDQIVKLRSPLALHTAQAQKRAWQRAVGHLLPMRWLGTQSAEEAQVRMHTLYGTRASLPAASLWPWPASTDWSNAEQPLSNELVLPAFGDRKTARKTSGPFADVGSLELDFHLVDEGVRIHLELFPRPQTH